MRTLLDECVPKRLGRELTGHQVKTAQQMGWAGIKNGSLLLLAEREFDLFITVDRRLSREQPIARLALAVIVLRARSNRFGDLLPFVPRVMEAARECKPGDVTFIG